MRKVAIALLLALTAISGGGIEMVRGQEADTPTHGDAVAAYTSQKYDAAATIWKPLAEEGSAEAAYRLGLMAERGHGMATDPAKAAAWYRQAAESEHAKALYSLANLHSTGRGVEEDPEAALDLYRQAAEAGEARAQYHMGRLYLDGGVVDKDVAEAHKWFAAATEAFPEGRERQRAAEARDALAPHVKRETAARGAP